MAPFCPNNGVHFSCSLHGLRAKRANEQSLGEAISLHVRSEHRPVLGHRPYGRCVQSERTNKGRGRKTGELARSLVGGGPIWPGWSAMPQSAFCCVFPKTKSASPPTRCFKRIGLDYQSGIQSTESGNPFRWRMSHAILIASSSGISLSPAKPVGTPSPRKYIVSVEWVAVGFADTDRSLGCGK